MYVSPETFSTLGVAPFVGRDFERADGAAGAEPVVMLAHAYWQRWHSADPDLIGDAVSINGLPVTVAGVMPPGFRILQDVDVFLAESVCLEAGRRAPDKILVLPPIAYGLNLHHIDFPGTMWCRFKP